MKKQHNFVDATQIQSNCMIDKDKTKIQMLDTLMLRSNIKTAKVK